MQALLLVKLLVSLSGSLTPENRKEAKIDFKEGADAYQSGNFELALKDFLRSYELSQLGELLFDIAQCHRSLSHWADARDYYERYIAEVPHGQSHEVAFQQLADVKQKLAEEQAARAKPPPEISLLLPPEPAPGLRVSPSKPTRAHPRPVAIALGGAGVVLGALAVVALVETLGFTGWKSQPPGSTLTASSVQSRVDTANTWATLALVSGLAAGAGLTAGVLTW